MTEKIPVLICGGRPVRLALAVELGARHSMHARRARQWQRHVPKMIQLSARTMEFCRRWGIGVSERHHTRFTSYFLTRRLRIE